MIIRGVEFTGPLVSKGFGACLSLVGARLPRGRQGTLAAVLGFAAGVERPTQPGGRCWLWNGYVAK